MVFQEPPADDHFLDFRGALAEMMELVGRLYGEVAQIRRQPRPGLIDALVNASINGAAPTDEDITGALVLLISGGFDTTTALTAHTLEWLSDHFSERARLSRERDTLLDSATEEFLRYYTPAPGNGRTISADCEIAGRASRKASGCGCHGRWPTVTRGSSRTQS